MHPGGTKAAVCSVCWEWAVLLWGAAVLGWVLLRELGYRAAVGNVFGRSADRRASKMNLIL